MNFKLWLENLERSVPTAFIDATGMVNLYRYSQAPRGETYVIDPAKTVGSRQPYSKNDYRATDIPRTFFYLDTNEKEDLTGKNLYLARFPAKEIYNLIADPLGFKAKTKEQSNGVLNFNVLLQMTIDAGYKGVYYNPGFHVVALFVPVVGHAVNDEQRNVA